MKDALREGIDRVVSHPACLPDASATDGDVAFAPPMPDFTSLMVRHQRTSRSDMWLTSATLGRFPSGRR